MVDTLSPVERSKRMARIFGKDTQPELTVRRLLHAQGFRFSLHRRDLPGRPDLVLAKYKAVVFVHGCFWHAHNCQKERIPDTRSAFWQDKFESNKRRDLRNTRKLRRLGWHVFTIWECELGVPASRELAISKLINKLRRGT